MAVASGTGSGTVALGDVVGAGGGGGKGSGRGTALSPVISSKGVTAVSDGAEGFLDDTGFLAAAVRFCGLRRTRVGAGVEAAA